MEVKNNFVISGVGRFLPTKRINSVEIEKELGLPEGWIMKRIGVAERYQVENETASSMGAAALREAMTDAKIEIQDINCIVGAAGSMDYVIPNRSCLIKNEFEEAKDLDFPCVDINSVCTSFVSALDHASYLLTARGFKHVAIVSAEISSKRLNPKDPETYSLFGDAAVAVIISASNSDAGIINFCSKTYTESIFATCIKGGGNVYDPKNFPFDETLYSFSMEGTKLLRHAKQVIPQYMSAFFKNADYSMTDIDWVIPHQTSASGMKIVKQMTGIEENKLINILEYYGNCIAASIPLGLYEAVKSGKLKPGQTALLIGTAAGLTISGILIRYAK